MKKSVSYKKTSLKNKFYFYSALFFRFSKRYLKQLTKRVLLSPLFHVSCKVLSILFVMVCIGYGSYFFISKTFADGVVVSQAEILKQVTRHTTLPETKLYSLVRVQDENALKSQNPFFSLAKVGDYIIVYENMVIIYDLRNDKIVAKKEFGAI